MADLINREQAVDAIDNELIASDYGNSELVAALNRLVGRMRRLPSAQRKGKWIYSSFGGYRCSECGNQASCNSFGIFLQLSEFCQNCGAEMEGVGE